MVLLAIAGVVTFALLRDNVAARQLVGGSCLGIAGVAFAWRIFVEVRHPVAVTAKFVGREIELEFDDEAYAAEFLQMNRAAGAVAVD
jgi:hypothetical protein